MEWDNDFYLYLLSFILVPIGIAIYRKQKPKKIVTDHRIIIMEEKIKTLEDDTIKNHIEIDEARIEIAYIKGRLSLD